MTMFGLSIDKPSTLASSATDRKKRRLSPAFDMLYCSGLFVFLLYCLFSSFDKVLDLPFEYLLLFTNGLFAIIGQVVSLRKNASIHFISFIFCYLFMSIAPMIQIGHNLDRIFNIDGIVLSTSAIALLFTITGVFFTSRMRKPPRDGHEIEIQNGHYLLLFMLTFFVGIVSLCLLRTALFTNRDDFGLLIETLFADRATATLASNFMTSVPFFGAAIGFRSAWVNRRHGWTLSYLFLLVLAALINNPFVNPRYKVAGLVFFLVDYLFNGKKLRLLVCLLLIGITVAPAFQAFRHATIGTESAQKAAFSDTFLSYDYDAFQTSCYTVLKTGKDGITGGSNIAGALLFFVPRAIWHGKPEQTAHIVYKTMLQYREIGTDNLSTPLMAEGYFAFSWIGALLISVVYWCLVSKIFVSSQKDNNSASFIARCMLASLALIFLRGSLIVGVAAVVGSFFAAFIPYFAFRFGTNRKLNA